MTYLGNHTKQVQHGLNMGFALFIISEVMAFFSVFWAFFHSSLSPDINIGSSWPPFGIDALDPFGIPLLNTILLLSSGDSLKWATYISYFLHLEDNVFSSYVLISTILPFNMPKKSSLNRIGPHNYDILSLLICHLLGDASAYKDSRGHGTNIRFYYSTVNSEYAYFIHSRQGRLISNLGYMSRLSALEKPNITYRDKGERSIIRFSTFTFSSFNWIYESFYINNVKTVPLFIGDYLTPQGLSHWIMDDGYYFKGRGLGLSTNSFTKNEVIFLSEGREPLKSKFNLVTSLHSTGNKDQFIIYIEKESLPLLTSIIKPYMCPSMYYKLGVRSISQKNI